MIDTIVLMLDKFNTFKEERFMPQTKQFGNHIFYKHMRNPTKKEVKEFGYLPRVTLMKRFGDIKLKIEFSAPKLVFGNNFDELTEKDFDKVVLALQKKLSFLDIDVFIPIIENSLVSGIHYSKNIPLTDGSIPYQYIKEVSKANINKLYDLNKTDYKDGGQSIKFRANTFEVIFYDKMDDIKKAKISDKRTIENEYATQLDLFSKINIQKPFELLRMEVRLNSRGKIRQMLKKINTQTEPTFKSLFKKKISQKILLYYLSYIKKAYIPILHYKDTQAQNFYADLLINNPKIRLNKSLEIMGLKTLLDEIGTTEFRNLAKRFGADKWYRLKRKTEGINYGQSKNNPFSLLEESIHEFKTFKLVDFQDRMLNNDKYE